MENKYVVNVFIDKEKHTIQMTDFIFFDFEYIPSLGSYGKVQQAGFVLGDIEIEWNISGKTGCIKTSAIVLENIFGGVSTIDFESFLKIMVNEFGKKIWVHWDGPEQGIIFNSTKKELLYMDMRKIWTETCDSGVMGKKKPTHPGTLNNKSGLDDALCFLFGFSKKQKHTGIQDALDIRDIFIESCHCFSNVVGKLLQSHVKYFDGSVRNYMAVAKGRHPGLYPYKTEDERKKVLAGKVIPKKMSSMSQPAKGATSWRVFGTGEYAKAVEWLSKKGITVTEEQKKECIPKEFSSSLSFETGHKIKLEQPTMKTQNTTTRNNNISWTNDTQKVVNTNAGTTIKKTKATKKENPEKPMKFSDLTKSTIFGSLSASGSDKSECEDKKNDSDLNNMFEPYVNTDIKNVEDSGDTIGEIKTTEEFCMATFGSNGQSMELHIFDKTEEVNEYEILPERILTTLDRLDKVYSSPEILYSINSAAALIEFSGGVSSNPFKTEFHKSKRSSLRLAVFSYFISECMDVYYTNTICISTNNFILRAEKRAWSAPNICPDNLGYYLKDEIKVEISDLKKTIIDKTKEIFANFSFEQKLTIKENILEELISKILFRTTRETDESFISIWDIKDSSGNIVMFKLEKISVIAVDF